MPFHPAFPPRSRAITAQRDRAIAAWPWLIGALLLAALIAAPGARASDALTTFNPNVNGTVNAIAYGDGVTYLGGAFSSVSYNSGSMARLDEATGLPDPNFPQVTNGLVDHILADGAGGWYISGEFTTVAGVTRNHIAHILPNETLDPNFNPDADNRVYNLKLIGNTLYCAGMFANIGGAARSKIAAIDATTGLATSWNPAGTAGTNGTIIWGLDTDGASLYIGGDFTSVNGTARNYIAAINIAAGTLSSWNPSASAGGTIYWLLYNAGDGLVYVGGTYSSIGGAARNNLAAINASGVATTWNPNVNGPVWHIIISSSNTLYAAGNFTRVNGAAARGYIAAWDVSTATTGTALAWNPNANGIVWWSAPVGNTLYVGGQFTSIGGQTRDYIAAVDQTTGLATSWAPAASAQVYTLATDGADLIAGGPFTAVSAGRANLVAVQSTNGAILPFNPGVAGTVDALALSGNTLYIGGAITAVDGSTVTDIAAVDATTGTLTGFAPALNGLVNDLALSGGTLYAGGAFTAASGSTRNRAAAWNTGTGALQAWNPNCNNTVNALAIEGSDILIGGTFTQLGGATVTRLGMTDLVNGTSTGFNGNCNNTVQCLWVGPTMFYAGGTFTTAGPSNSARKLAAAWDISTNALDATWIPNLTGTTVLAIGGYLNDLFLGGTFTKVGATSINDLASVSPTTGAINAGFVPAPTPTGNVVNCFCINSASPLFTLFVGGSFTAMGGATRDEAASFDLDQPPAALALSGSTVANNSANGTVIGTFTPTDPNPNDTFTYTLSSSAGGLFGISGSQLVVANTSVFTSPPPASYSITAVVTDADGQSFSQSFAITDVVVKATPVITWSSPAAIVYGTALGATQLDATANVPGTFAYTPAAGSVLAAGSQPLSVTFTPTDTTDYSLANASTTIAVTKSGLTVTANNASRIFNTPNPAFTASYSGFVNGDTASSLGGTLAFATSAIQSSPKGTYPITPSGLTSPNYTLSFVSGTLTIATAAPVVTWNAPANIVYGTALSATQLDATASVPGTFAYAPAAGAVLNAGASQVLSVTFTPTDTVDYTTVTSNQSITVAPAALTVTATSVSRPYNTANPTLGVTYSGFVNGDTAASLGGVLSVATTATTASPVGLYPITATGQTSHNYNIAYVAGTLTVAKATPVLTWPNPAALTYGAVLGATQLDASANTAGTFVYAPAAGAILGAGSQTLSVTFTPTDAADYTQATATATLVVNQATPAIAWATPAAITYGTALSGTQLDASSPVAGTFAYTPVSGTVLGAGAQVLKVTLTPTDAVDYTTATAQVTLQVNQATPTIAWANPAAITYGTALSATQLDASGSVPGTFAYAPAAGTVLGAGAQVLKVTLTPTDAVDYTTATAQVTLQVNPATPTIAWAAPAAITYGTALSGTQLDASSPVAGTFAYTPVSGTVLSAGAQILKVILTPTDAVDYTTATAQVTLQVNKATPTIAWAAPAAITYGTALSGTQLDATGSVPGTFAYAPAAGAVLGAGSQTLKVTLTPTDAVDYTTATAQVTLQVNQATPTIAWATPAAITYGTALSGAQLNASSPVAGTFAYTPVSGTVLGAGAQVLKVTLTPTDAVDYTTATAQVTLQVNQATPTIAWATPAAITYGTALSAAQLNATGSVPGTFAYNPVSGTVLGAGAQVLKVTLTPTDAGDYTTATAQVTLQVNQATPTIAWAAPAAIIYGTALSATQLDASSPVAGAFAYTPVAGTVLSAGAQILKVTLTPTDAVDYTTATAQVTLQVNQATPTIAWATPAAITYGTALSGAQLDASSPVAGTFAYTPGSGAVLSAGAQVLKATLTPTDAVDYTTATAQVTLQVNQAAPTITWAAPAAITYGTALNGTQLDATGSVPGTFAYAPASGTVLGAGAQILKVTLTPTDAVDYTTATAQVTLQVNQATPTITWATPAAITYGTALSAAQLNATGSVPGTFAYVPAAGAVLGAGSQTLKVTLTPTDAVDYTTATAQVTLQVNQATPTIAWSAPAAIIYGTALSATQLDASSPVAGAFAYTPVSGTVLGAGAQVLKVTLTPTDAVDYTTATAQVTLQVNKATPTIAWATPAAVTYGTALSGTQLDASSPVAGTFAYAPAAGAVLGAGAQTLKVTLTPTDAVDYTTATAQVTLQVNQAAPTITWAAPAAITYGTALNGTQLDATGSVPGTFAYAPASGTVLGAGAQILKVTLTPTDAVDYTTATAQVTLQVNQATPTIAWATPAAITYGTALSGAQLDASSPIAGAFAYTPVSGTVLGAGAQVLKATLTPTDAVDYTTAIAQVTLQVNQATPTIAWATPAAITYGTALSATQLDATGSVPGTFTYIPAAGTVLGAGAQVLKATLTPTDAVDYTTATAQVTLQVNKATPTIAWANPAAITYGTALNGTQLNANSPVAGTFAYSPAAGAILGAGSQTLSVTLTPTDATDYTLASATATLVVNQATPAITWANPAAIAYGTALSATQLDASSPVAGTFAYTPVSGTVLGAGAQVLKATLTPTDAVDYTTATAQVTLQVNQATPTIAWATPAAIAYGTALSATQLDASSPVAGTFAYTPVSGTVLGAGAQVLKATLTPTDAVDYTTATAQVTLQVNQATPTITWAIPAAITYGTALSGTQLDASSPVAGTFAYAPAAGTVLGAGAQVLKVTLTPTDAVDYTTSVAQVSLQVNKATPTITWATPAAITYGTALSGTQLDATGSVPGTFAYTPVSGTVLGAGAQVLKVTLTPTDAVDYTTATAQVTLQVNQATPTIAWANPAAITYGTALSGTQLDASSPVAGTFAYTPTAGTVLGAGAQILKVTLTPTDAVDYTTATAQATLQVNQATPTIAWANPAAITYGTALSATQLDASSPVAGTFAYAPASGTVLGAGAQVLKVTLTPTDAVDYTTATAQATLQVNQATPTIAWATPAAITYGTALSATQLDASSPVAGTFAYAPASGTVLGAGAQVLKVTLTPTDAVDYTTATAQVTLQVNRATPTITWATPAAITYGMALSATQLDATGSVPGTFAYTPAAGTVLGAGSQTLKVTLTPTDAVDYTTATAQVTLLVNQATPTITWAAPAAITYGTALSATQLDATGSVPGTFAYAPAAGIVLGAGSQTLKATLTPTDAVDYTTATAQVTLQVNQATPTITWAAPAAITYGTALSATQLDATGSVPGTFAYTPAAGTVLGAGSQTLKVTLTPTDAVDYTTATAQVTLQVNQATPAIIWANPAAITYGVALSGTQLNAIGSVPGAFAYNPVSGTVLGAGAQILRATLTPTDAVDYTTATAQVTLQVNQAAPTITWATPAAITYGTALSAMQLDATGSVPGTFAYNPVSGAVLGAGAQVLKVTLTPTDAVDYTTATAQVTLQVNKATPTIAWATPAAITYGTALSGTQLDASSPVAGTFAYNPVSGTVLGAGAQTLKVTLTPTDAVDYTTATGQVTLQVNQAVPTIAWANPVAITYGTALSATQLNATGSVPGTFAYTPAAGAVLGAGAQVLRVTLTPTDAADYTTATAQATLQVNQATPTIAWANPAAITYGTALSGTQLDASSPVAGTFAYTPVSGAVLGAGAQVLKVTLTPTDAVDYTTATAQVTLQVNQATPTIAWTTPAAITYGTALSGTQLDATGSVPGTFAYNPVSGTVLGAGAQVLKVTLTPTDAVDYTTATAQVTLQVNQATPTIAWATPAAITYGTALSGAQLDASSPVAGTFAYTPVSGTVLGAGAQVLKVTLTPTDAADYTTATAQVTLQVNKATPTIAWANPAAITYGTALNGTQLDASSPVAGTFAYTPVSGTVLGAGAQVLKVTLTPTDAVDYTTATAQVTLQVNQATPTIAWANPAAITYGTALSATQLDATGSVPGTFAYAPAAGTVLGAGAQVLKVTLTPTDAVDYTTATAQVTLQVNPATPTIAWAAPAAITYGTALSGTQLDASSPVAGTFAYTPVSGTVLSAGAQILKVTLTPTDAVDYTTATAQVTLQVNKATPTIAWAAPAAITYGTALSGTQLDATGSVPGTFAYAPAAGAVLGAGSQTLKVTLTPTDAVDYTTATAQVTLQVNQATPTIAWANPAAITYGTALSGTQLDASSPVAGTFAYTPVSGTVLGAGAQVLKVTLTPTDAVDYTTATAQVTLQVNQATPTMAWATPAAITYGTALSGAQLDASSPVAGTFAYTPVSGTVLGAGAQVLKVTLTPTDAADYTTATAQVTLQVNKATPTITWATPAAITYGTALNGTQLDASSPVAGTFAYTPVSGTVLGAGAQVLKVTLTPTDAADYTTATAQVTLQVNKATPTIAWATPAAITYGMALSAAQLDATGSVPGTFAYTPVSGAVLGAGAQVLKVTLTPTDAVDYTTATAQVTLQVNQAVPTIAWATPAAITYGTALSATQLNATGSVPGTFAYAPAAGTVLGAGAQVLKATLTPTDAVDYATATAQVTLQVNKATPTITWANPAAITYGTALSAIQLDATSSLAGGSFAYTPVSGAVLNAGTQSLSVSYTPSAANAVNYLPASAAVALVVNQAVLQVAAPSPTRSYGDVNPAFAPNYAGFVNGDTASVLSGAPSLTTVATINSLPGPYTIVAGLGGLSAANYTFSFVNGTMTVTKAVLTVTANNASKAYGAALPAFTYAITGYVLGQGSAVVAGAPTLSTTATKASPVVAGGYPIIPAQNTLSAANYTFAMADGILTINPVPLKVTAANKSKVYGAALPAFTVTYAGFVNGDTAAKLTGAPALSSTGTAASAVGSYPITVSKGTLADANYTFSFVSGTLAITPATLTVTAANATKVYGAALPAFTATYAGFKNGDTTAVLSGSPSLTTTATSASAVGTYPIAAAVGTLAATNYVFTFKNGTLTVTKAALTVTATSLTKAYGAALPALTYGFSGFVNGDTAANITGAPTLATTAKATSAAGSYPITIKAGTLAATDYTFTLVKGTMTVTKAVLTVTASNASRAYGAANPAFSVNYAGFVNGDTSAVVSGKAAITTTATAASQAGSYAIVPALGTLKATNYSFAFVNGTLTVTKATLTVTAKAAARTYGAPDPVFSVTYSGFLNGDTAAVLSGAPSFTTTASLSSPVGAYTVSPTLGTLAATSYTFAFVNGAYTVTKATLIVTAAPVSRPYGSANPALTYVLTGFLNGDPASVVSGKPTLTTAVVATTAVGSYPITVAVGTLAATNYAFSAMTSNTFTVTPAVLAVNVASTSRAYGAANPIFSYALSGFVNGQNASTPGLLSGAPVLSTTAIASSPAGTYPIGGTSGTLSAANYAFTIVPGLLTVGQAVLIVTVNAESVYGSAPVLTPSYSGFLNGDTASVISGTPTLASGVSAATPVGVYLVTVSGSLTAANYSFAYLNGTVTVNPAALSVFGNDGSTVTGAAIPPLSATVVGFVNGETSAVLAGTLSLTTTATSASAPGSYPVVPSGVSDANYDITFVDGALIVLGLTGRASVANDGSQLVGDSILGAISGDGSVLAFTSDATNLPGAIAGTPQVYVKQGGVVSLVSNGAGGQAALSNDGRYITYIAPEGALFNSPFEVVVYDRQTQSTTIESVADGVEADDWCTDPLISDGGRYVAYEATSTVLTGVPDTGNRDIILRDRKSGTNTVVSIDMNGIAGTGDCNLSALSADGRYIAFSSSSTTMQANLPNLSFSNPYLGYVYDRVTGTLRRIDLTPSGGQSDNGVGYGMSFSSDDRWLAFSSNATNLVPGVTNGCENVYVLDLTAPQSTAISLVDRNAAGVLSDQACYAPKISGDGRYVAFLDDGTDFDATDTNGVTDAYLADRQTGHIARVSLSSTGTQGDNYVIYQLAFSRDATTLCWYSFADDLVPGDTNGNLDIFEIPTWILPGQDAPPTPPNGNG